ncbi:MAG: endonuclease/exonuclease/phosphatase family protein [Bacteroidota bacterium]
MRSNIILLMIFFIHFHVLSQDISLMTYNIRYGLADDGENSWEYRKEFLASQIKFYDPDIIGTQEGLPFQMTFLDSQLTKHSFIGLSRDGDGKGEYSAIFYNTNKFKVIKHNTFWLSTTPEKISKGWDAALPRICTYALFENIESNIKFWVFNTHLDHIGKQARKQSVFLILNKIENLNTNNYPVIFMGDFNDTPDKDPIIKITTQMNDTKDNSIDKPFGPAGTFNAFQFDKSVTKRIDYIFLSKNNIFKVKKYAVLSDSKDLKYPSDHLPVYVELKINKNI